MEYVASPARAGGERRLDKPTSLMDANRTSFLRDDRYQGGCFMFWRLGTGNLRQTKNNVRVHVVQIDREITFLVQLTKINFFTLHKHTMDYQPKNLNSAKTKF